MTGLFILTKSSPPHYSKLKKKPLYNHRWLQKHSNSFDKTQAIYPVQPSLNVIISVVYPEFPK